MLLEGSTFATLLNVSYWMSANLLKYNFFKMLSTQSRCIGVKSWLRIFFNAKRRNKRKDGPKRVLSHNRTSIGIYQEHMHIQIGKKNKEKQRNKPESMNQDPNENSLVRQRSCFALPFFCPLPLRRSIATTNPAFQPVQFGVLIRVKFDTWPKEQRPKCLGMQVWFWETLQSRALV